MILPFTLVILFFKLNRMKDYLIRVCINCCWRICAMGAIVDKK
jgi:hypothetical protein